MKSHTSEGIEDDGILRTGAGSQVESSTTSEGIEDDGILRTGAGSQVESSTGVNWVANWPCLRSWAGPVGRRRLLASHSPQPHIPPKSASFGWLENFPIYRARSEGRGTLGPVAGLAIARVRSVDGRWRLTDSRDVGQGPRGERFWYAGRRDQEARAPTWPDQAALREHQAARSRGRLNLVLGGEGRRADQGVTRDPARVGRRGPTAKEIGTDGGRTAGVPQLQLRLGRARRPRPRPG